MSVMEYELYHYGVKGQKWGIRRYQNKDGSLTEAGKRRVNDDGTFKTNREYRKHMASERSLLDQKYRKRYGADKAYDDADDVMGKRAEELGKEWDDLDPEEYERIYAKADSLSSKSYKAAEADMRKKYGKDYDAFCKYEKRVNTATVVGGIALTAAITVGTVKATQLAGRAIVKGGEAVVKALLK